MPSISLILPTRGRPDRVQKLFNSLKAETARPEEVEIVMVVDEDDPESHHLSHPDFPITRVILPPGQTMGQLNFSAIEASSGRILAFFNDDIVVRTRHWDLEVVNMFREFPDEILLLHPNDLLFRDQLCCFPIVSRRAAMEINHTPEGYRRYCIDDHIYDVYNMLSWLGHQRIVYAPWLVFEHENFIREPKLDLVTHLFRSSEGKYYIPEHASMAADAVLYRELFPSRREAALTLARLIDELREGRPSPGQRPDPAQATAAVQRLEAANRSAMKLIQDSRSYRYKDLVSTRSAPTVEVGGHPPVTVGILSRNPDPESAARCRASLTRQLQNVDVITLDTRTRADVLVGRELNRLLRAAATDYVVLVEDQCVVEPGWLPRLLEAAQTSRAGVVGATCTTHEGLVESCGAYLVGGDSGMVEAIPELSAEPRPVQVLSTPLMLINATLLRGLSFDEDYLRYFHDAAFCLKVWEAGHPVVATPGVIVSRVNDAGLLPRTNEEHGRWSRDHQVFRSMWGDTPRYRQLESGIWKSVPGLTTVVETPQRLLALPRLAREERLSELRQEVGRLLRSVQNFPAMLGIFQVVLDEVSRLVSTRADQAMGPFLASTGATLQELRQRPARILSLCAVAERLFQRGRTESAQDLLEEALRMDGGSAPVLLRLGHLHESQGALDKALMIWQTAVRRAPRATPVLTGMARAHDALGEPAQALHCYRMEARLRPQAAGLWKEILRLAELTGDEAARKEAETALTQA